ncbi:MAG: phosphoribosyltransferase family protein [Akkermansia sp.]|nr:phosphoribosyltransferase family protein [Akkermansia sp.]
MSTQPHIRPLFTEREIRAALERVAAQVLERFGTQEPVQVLAVLNGGLWFAADLLRLLPPNFLLDTVRISSYGDAQHSSGTLSWLSRPADCRGMRVLVLDDVLDTGTTLQGVVAELRAMGAAEVCTAVAVDKRERRSCPFSADFAALQVQSGFLVGYGLDFAGRYRNLPFIGVLEQA